MTCRGCPDLTRDTRGAQTDAPVSNPGKDEAP
jgi:hypothetical protein